MRNFFNSVSKIFKPDLNEVGNDGYTPLQRAISENNINKVLSLIEKGADLNKRGTGMYPPLHLAMKKERYQMAMELIRAGADLNLADELGHTPLHQAMRQNQEMFILSLLKLNADPNAKDFSGRTPLFLVDPSNPSLVDELVKYNARINEQDMSGNTALHHYMDHPAIAERLLLNGADPNICNKSGVSPYAMMLDENRLRHYPEMLQKMLALKANLGSTNALGETILHLAARLEMEDVFRKVLVGSELKARDANGNNVLHALVRTFNTRMIERVLERAPGLIDERNDEGFTPLGELLRRASHPIHGFSTNYIATARTLLQHGANPNDTDDKGRGLLHHAIVHDKMTFLEDILMKGANPDLTDRSGKTALHYAIENHNLRAMDILLDRGADPDMADPRGWTILDRLAEHGDRDSSMVQRLIVAGGQYQKQLPLHPEMMHPRHMLDKGKKPATGHKDGPRL